MDFSYLQNLTKSFDIATTVSCKKSCVVVFRKVVSKPLPRSLDLILHFTNSFLYHSLKYGSGELALESIEPNPPAVVHRISPSDISSVDI